MLGCNVYDDEDIDCDGDHDDDVDKNNGNDGAADDDVNDGDDVDGNDGDSGGDNSALTQQDRRGEIDGKPCETSLTIILCEKTFRQTLTSSKRIYL